MVFVGEGVAIMVVEIRGKEVKLGITAPPEISISREKVKKKEKQEK
ncbi:MAG: carbon storage regulator [Desulfobaccales bacterium]|nr:carbon storage regulator [Desulfobaccales bacterium]